MLFLANMECCPQFLEYALEGSLLFAKVPRNSWCWFDWPLKDEMLSWPWSHPVILNLGPLDWKFSTLTTRPLHHVRVSSNLKTTEPDFFKKSCFGIFGPKGLEMKCWVFMKNQHMEFFWFFALSYSNISPAVELNDFRVKNPFFFVVVVVVVVVEVFGPKGAQNEILSFWKIDGCNFHFGYSYSSI